MSKDVSERLLWVADVRCRGGEEILGRFCIVTVPLGVLSSGKIAFTPPLPTKKTDSISRLGVAKVNKVVLHFRSAFWQQVTSGVISIAIRFPGFCFRHRL